LRRWFQDIRDNGFAIFHDEKTNAPDFANIRERFPFREDRKPSDLADRWRELTDRLEGEDQETMTRIKNQVKTHRAQTWTYKFEPQADLPPLDDILEEYRQIPSLAMKTQFTEISNSRFMAEPKSINESCLNYQFEAMNVNRIVQDVLQKILLKDADDEPLRKTILGQFHNGLAAKGRIFAIEDTNRRLEVINEMTDHALAETETQIMIGNFERILTGIQLRNRQGSSVLAQTVID
jgi:predicted nuclease with TOPRIM domain